MTAEEDELSGHLNQGWVYEDQVPGEAAGVEVVAFYARAYPRFSATDWRQRIEAGLIRLDGDPVNIGTRLRPGQRLTYHRPPWREEPVPAGFAVLHEDDDLVALAKPAGLPSLPGGGFLESTLLYRARARYGPSLVPAHRLGRGTSGVMLFARTGPARTQLAADFATDAVMRVYRALVQGTGMVDRFEVTARIGPVPYPGLGSLHAATPDGREARSECTVLERRQAEGQAVVQVIIHTGRPHQVRVHLAAAGWPLAGDPLYRAGGVPAPPEPGRTPLPGDGGYLLHAHRVTLQHPVDRRPLTICCRPPAILRLTGE
ncbi:MAG: RluA family pseudouridine synthase [Candidatus Latescibacterota bacterium]|jgi:23S rRNA pseudouridine1911/1915/1917 synthase